MSDLMADDRHKLVVGHYIHKRREYADRAVAAGESVDVDHIVNLEVELHAAGLGYTLGKAFEPCIVLARIDRVMGVHPFDRLAAQGGDILVREGYGGSHIANGLHGLSGVDLAAADAQLRVGRCDAEKRHGENQ